MTQDVQRAPDLADTADPLLAELGLGLLELFPFRAALALPGLLDPAPEGGLGLVFCRGLLRGRA